MAGAHWEKPGYRSLSTSCDSAWLAKTSRRATQSPTADAFVSFIPTSPSSPPNARLQPRRARSLDPSQYDPSAVGCKHLFGGSTSLRCHLTRTAFRSPQWLANRTTADGLIIAQIHQRNVHIGPAVWAATVGVDCRVHASARKDAEVTLPTLPEAPATSGPQERQVLANARLAQNAPVAVLVENNVQLRAFLTTAASTPKEEAVDFTRCTLDSPYLVRINRRAFGKCFGRCPSNYVVTVGLRHLRQDRGILKFADGHDSRHIVPGRCRNFRKQQLVRQLLRSLLARAPIRIVNCDVSQRLLTRWLLLGNWLGRFPLERSCSDPVDVFDF